MACALLGKSPEPNRTPAKKLQKRCGNPAACIRFIFVSYTSPLSAGCAGREPFIHPSGGCSSKPRIFFRPMSARTTKENSRLFLLFFLASLAAFGPFVTDFYLPTLPEQAADFKATPSLVQLGLSATMWGLAAGQLFVGPLSDRTGRRKPLAWSLALFAASTFGAFAAQSIEVFLVMRFLEGLGASGGIVMSRSIAADRYTGKALGSFMSIMGAIQGIAPISAPLLGSLVAAAVGWRGIFELLFAIGVVLLVVTIFVLAETHPVKKARRTAEQDSAAGAPRETLRESFAILFKDPIFVGIVIQQIFASAILFAHISSSPFIFRGHFGLPSELYGLLFGLMAIGISVGATASSRFQPGPAMDAGAWGMLGAAALVALSFAFGLSLWATIPLYVLLLIALGLTLPAAMTLALSRHRTRSGLAAAILGAVGFGGGGLVAPLTTAAAPEVATPAIFLVSGAALVILSIVMKRFRYAPAPAVREAGAELDLSGAQSRSES